jgi:hypothetical protein
LEALAEVTITQGREPPGEFQLPKDIKVVSATAWMNELVRANVIDDEGTNPRTRFNELRTSLAARHIIGVRDDFVWLARPPSPYAKAANGGGEPRSADSSIPFMITIAMKDDLKRRGFSDDAIFTMTPQHAREILADPNRNPDTERFKVVGEVLPSAACAQCGKGDGVRLYRDSRQPGSKPAALHLRCAAEHFNNDEPPL